MQPNTYLEKVTAFVTRPAPQGTQMLLLLHPHAGLQFPAGTVEEGEAPDQAVLREVAEETGLEDVRIVQFLGERFELPPDASHVISQTTSVYARPSPGSAAWCVIPRGVGVSLLRESSGYAQISYIETDRFPAPSYVSYQITGWVPANTLAEANRRYFYHLEFTGTAPAAWPQVSDNHTFQAFWSPIASLPDIISPQRAWLDYVTGPLAYRFE